jgi:hypothetical protein
MIFPLVLLGLPCDRDVGRKEHRRAVTPVRALRDVEFSRETLGEAYARRD